VQVADASYRDPDDETLNAKPQIWQVRDAYERDIALEPEAESDGVEEEASEDGEREYSKDE
jgi:hypothetical protein